MALPGVDATEDDPSGDVKADVSVMDPFIPGGVLRRDVLADTEASTSVFRPSSRITWMPRVI